MRTSTRKFNLRGRNYYEVLGVGAWTDADEIRLAWHEAALVFHPDHGGSDAGFRLIQEAYETLGDSHKRAAYDKEHGLGPSPHSVEVPSDQERHAKSDAKRPGTPTRERSAGRVENEAERRAVPDRQARTNKMFGAIVDNIPTAACLVAIVWSSVAIRSLIGGGLWGVLNPSGVPSWPGVPVTVLLVGTLWACLAAAGLRWWAKPWGGSGLVVALSLVGAGALFVEYAISLGGVLALVAVLALAMVARSSGLFVRK